MDYETAVATFFAPPPPGTEPPPASLRASGARRLRDAIEPIATQGIWAREVNERCADLGLDFLGTYVWGRAASLGTPPPALVTATFGVFAPALVESVFAGAAATADRDAVLAAREAGAVASLRRVLGEPDGVAELTALLRRGLAGAHLVARPLYAALAALPVPADPWGALWRVCELLREHRGDAHLAVCLSAGLDPVRMNVLTELTCGMTLGSYTASRGWSPEEIGAAVATLTDDGLLADGALTEAGEELRAVLEDMTDDAEDAVVAGIGEDLEDVLARLADLSGDLIEAGAFPADPAKRAAG
ncbi:hypothetical protein RHODO2019_10695 [Rhodococcus antarcticus]|uniref:SalK n=1 Tax=Rhodococcus antarcticus TaxID=2987751 RepID=A0ABY6NWA7_9NOCA|nr:hypothetical protein [Rhodococcus antarcticus]UZJ23677.1 hypothetical protein RHODO2019_10695 [Rhodococcus antarcticus]